MPYVAHEGQYTLIGTTALLSDKFSIIPINYNCKISQLIRLTEGDVLACTAHPALMYRCEEGTMPAHLRVSRMIRLEITFF